MTIHEYLLSSAGAANDGGPRNQNDEMGTRIVKTIINELVKLKREDIWLYYEGVEAHPTPDQCIKRWIQIILRSLVGSSEAGSAPHRPQTAQPHGAPSFGELIEELKVDPDSEDTMRRIRQHLQANPNIDLNLYLEGCSAMFRDHILAGIRGSSSGLQQPQQHQSSFVGSTTKSSQK